jgi:hypothetical protein
VRPRRVVFDAVVEIGDIIFIPIYPRIDVIKKGSFGIETQIDLRETVAPVRNGIHVMPSNLKFGLLLTGFVYGYIIPNQIEIVK